MAKRDVWVVVGGRRVRADLVKEVEVCRDGSGLALKITGVAAPLTQGLPGCGSNVAEAMVAADMLLVTIAAGARLEDGALIDFVQGEGELEAGWQLVEMLPEVEYDEDDAPCGFPVVAGSGNGYAEIKRSPAEPWKPFRPTPGAAPPVGG
jgi:hypothetical protein